MTLNQVRPASTFTRAGNDNGNGYDSSSNDGTADHHDHDVDDPQNDALNSAARNNLSPPTKTPDYTLPPATSNSADIDGDAPQCKGHQSGERQALKRTAAMSQQTRSVIKRPTSMPACSPSFCARGRRITNGAGWRQFNFSVNDGYSGQFRPTR